jgi:hypothetical protein
MTKTRTPGGLAERLREARTSADVLATKSDALNDMLTQAEEAIAALRLGVTGRVVLDTDPEDGVETSLGFKRCDGRWCLTIDVSHPFSEQITTTQLLKASRDLRVRAGHSLGPLVVSMIDAARQEIELVDASASAAAAFVGHMREAQS